MRGSMREIMLMIVGRIGANGGRPAIAGPRRVLLVMTALVAALSAPAVMQAQPSLVILVRHGEKQAVPGSDPSLSEAGMARARALNEALAHTTPNAIVVTPYKRTQETAGEVTRRTGLTPVVVPVAGAHVKAVAEAVMKATGVVLVVGHSNTVPGIVTALGGPKLSDICDASYATMFVFTPARGGQPAQLVTASYGTPDAPGATTCAPTGGQ